MAKFTDIPVSLCARWFDFTFCDGVNPSHTIAAVVEPNVETTIRRITGRKDWRALEIARTVPVIDPLSAVIVPTAGTIPTNM